MTRLLIATLLAAALAGPAAAQTANAPGNTAAHATVGPQAIPGDTREQKLAFMEAKLREADSNGDGKLSLSEWEAAGGKRAGFEALDFNHDDVLTRQEFRSNARKLKAFNDFVAASPY
ncbi:MAG: hypothetical protein RL490_2509 [Pseudomonadota bacterium]|jgi:TRAP-type C4-dicarboxylate transport system substrate-binding protein